MTTIVEVYRENGDFKLKSLLAALSDYEREIKLTVYPIGEHAATRIDFMTKILSDDCVLADKSSYHLHQAQFHVNG